MGLLAVRRGLNRVLNAVGLVDAVLAADRKERCDEYGGEYR